MSPRSKRGAARTAAARPAARAITERTLRAWPLPGPDAGGDKEDRGRVLVVGGATTLPGAIVLAGTAVLRAGAGKLQLATCRSIAVHVGVVVPEALVVALTESAEGGIAPSAAGQLAEHAERADVLLLGPGMVHDWAIGRLLERLLPRTSKCSVVLDAGALAPLAENPTMLHHLAGRAVVTPHAGEMATLLGVSEQEVERDPSAAAQRAAAALRAVVVLKGAQTIVAAPDGTLLRYEGGRVGLATSGSGDTLAGVVAGLVARGSPPVQGAAWGVFLHGEAGNALSRRLGQVGYLARELLDEVPLVMARLAKPPRAAGRRPAGGVADAGEGETATDAAAPASADVA